MSHLSTLVLPRRQLLASAAVAGLFGPSLLTQSARAAGADGEVLTGSHWGAFHAKVQGGRFVAIRPWEKDPHPTAQLPGVMDFSLLADAHQVSNGAPRIPRKGPGCGCRQPWQR